MGKFSIASPFHLASFDSNKMTRQPLMDLGKEYGGLIIIKGSIEKTYLLQGRITVSLGQPLQHGSLTLISYSKV
jgi:hypothetical protein